MVDHLGVLVGVPALQQFAQRVAPGRRQPLDGVRARPGHLEAAARRAGPTQAIMPAASSSSTALAQPVGVDPELGRRPPRPWRRAGRPRGRGASTPGGQVEAGPAGEHLVELAPVLVADGTLQDQLDLVERVPGEGRPRFSAGSESRMALRSGDLGQRPAQQEGHEGDGHARSGTSSGWCGRCRRPPRPGRRRAVGGSQPGSSALRLSPAGPCCRWSARSTLPSRRLAKIGPEHGRPEGAADRAGRR